MLKYWVWLSELKGLRNQTKLALLRRFGDPESIFYADPDELMLTEGADPGQLKLLENHDLAPADKILAETGVNPDTRVKDLTEEDVSKLRDYIEKNIHVEGDLRREVSMNIKRLIEIGCYRGVRHRKNLPVRGQSSKQNARTRKGPKRTVSRSKKAAK